MNSNLSDTSRRQQTTAVARRRRRRTTTGKSSLVASIAFLLVCGSAKAFAPPSLPSSIHLGKQRRQTPALQIRREKSQRQQNNYASPSNVDHEQETANATAGPSTLSSSLEQEQREQHQGNARKILSNGDIDAVESTNQAATANTLDAAAASVSKQLASLLGTDIDEQRLAFPELANGEVTRLFSTLEYTTISKVNNIQNGTTTIAKHASGSTFGAAALVSGTTIGAGVLALPTATVGAGFLPSTLGMTVAWIIMTASGLLIAELSLNRLGETGRPGLGLLDLYDALLGKTFGVVASVAYFFLHYAVMCAYMAQGGSNMKSFLETIFAGTASTTTISMSGFNFNAILNAVPGIGQLIFVGIGGVAIYTARQSIVEKVNNAMVLGVLASFLGILTLGIGSADFGALIDPANQHPEALISAIPILFLSIVFHNVVPTVVAQLEGDRSKITKAIVVGTTMPFLMLVAWNAVILANVLGMASGVSTSIDPVSLLQQSGSGSNSVLSSLVGTFSELALITSLVGFVYGMLDAWTDVFGIPNDGPEFKKWRPALFAGVLLPPLLLSMSDPDIFYKALDYGGAFGVTTLFLVLPPIMVWKSRYGTNQGSISTKPIVPLGKIPLVVMLGTAGVLITQQAFEKFGIGVFLQNYQHLVQ